jgi:hypothetical protein
MTGRKHYMGDIVMIDFLLDTDSGDRIAFPYTDRPVGLARQIIPQARAIPLPCEREEHAGGYNFL